MPANEQAVLTDASQYKPGVIGEVMSRGEVAVNFRNVTHLGIDYRTITERKDVHDPNSEVVEKGQLTMGQFVKGPVGHVDECFSYSGMPIIHNHNVAFEVLQMEARDGLNEGVLPNIAYVIFGRVMAEGSPIREKQTPHNYQLTDDTYICRNGEDMARSKSIGTPISLVVYNADIMKTKGLRVPNSAGIQVTNMGRALEETLGLQYGQVDVQVGSKNLYVSGEPTLSGDAGFSGDHIEFRRDSIAVLARRDKDNGITVASFQPTLKEKLDEAVVKEAVKLARKR